MHKEVTACPEKQDQRYRSLARDAERGFRSQISLGTLRSIVAGPRRQADPAVMVGAAYCHIS